jgi:CRP-like cAMP-binding protein
LLLLRSRTSVRNRTLPEFSAAVDYSGALAVLIDDPLVVALMSTLPAKPINRLLAALRSETVERLRLRPVTLKSKQVVMQADRTIDYVYFPTRGIVSALAAMAAAGRSGSAAMAIP